MTKVLHRTNRLSWLLFLLIASQLTVQAQTTLTLSDRSPSGSIFEGTVFQAGTQFGNASIYATFGGTGTRSFQIDSPGENLTKTITSDGFFDIIPVGSLVVDKTKIKNFTGTITGSVTITARPLQLTTLATDVTTDIAPGAGITVSYLTGPGTYPLDLALKGYKVQLLDAGGTFLRDLQNPTQQSTPREQPGYSNGDVRLIKATLPADLLSGTYRVRVVTDGLIQNINGTVSPTFTVKAATLSLTPGTLGAGSYCAGTTVSFPFSTSSTFAVGNVFKVQLSDAAGITFQDLPETGTTSPVRATLPGSTAGGAYKFRIVSSSPVTISTTGTINVAALPTVTVSGNSASIAGSPATVQLAFTGTPPWSFTYTDNSPDYAPTFTRTASVTTATASINPTLYTSVTYGAGFLGNFKDAGCGVSDQIRGSAALTVTPLTISVIPPTQTYCPGVPIPIAFSTTSKLPADAICQVQLSDEKGDFQLAKVIGTGGRTSPITATPNLSLVAGTGYRIRIVLQKSTTQGAPDYNNSIVTVPAALTLTRPPLPMVTDVFFCSGTSPGQLTAIGTNLKWFVVGDSVMLAGPPTPPNNRNSNYLVSQTIAGCASSLAPINVYQKAQPAAPAVTNVAVCQGGAGQVTSSIPGALWYTTATGGTGTTQPPVLNSQTAGEQTLYVSQNIDGCESARATVKITVTPIPQAPAAPTPAPVCQYATAGLLSATGSGLIWYDQSGKLPGAPIPNTTTSGIKSYSVSQTNGGCESARTVVSQLVQPAPAAPTAAPVRSCVGDPPTALTATGSTLKWYAAPTGGSSLAAAPSFSTATAAVFTAYVTQTDNLGCESLRQSVSLSVVSAPTAPVVTPTQVVCQLAQTGPLTASPNTGLLWQGYGITGTSETAPTPNTTQPGTFTYAVSQKAGSCSSPTALITVIVLKSPDAPIVVSPVNLCIGQTSSPLIAGSTGGTLAWYLNSSHTGSSLAQVTPTTGQAGTTTYYVTQYITQTDGKRCESPNSAIEVRVQIKATAKLTGDEFINIGDSTAIRVQLTGNGPWKFTNWNGDVVQTSNPFYVKWERPDKPKTIVYEISSFSGACGTGEVLNSYTLLVRPPLGVLPTGEPTLLITYPNPTADELSVDWSAPTGQTVSLQLFSTTGVLVKQVSRQATGVQQTERFGLGAQPAGLYIIRLLSPPNGILTQVVVRQ